MLTSSMSRKKRDYRVDSLRALCIILVVLAHSIIIYNGEWNLYSTNHSSVALRYLCNFIYLFHMPLFFSISGFLFYKKEPSGNLKGLATKKFARLLIPFFVIGLLYMIPIRFIAHYSGYKNYLEAVLKLLTGLDAGHLWFLPTLFGIFIYEYIVTRYIKDKRIRDVLVIVAFLLGFVVPLYFGRMLSNVVWFHAGYRIKELKLFGRKNVGYASVPPFIVLSIAYFVLPSSFRFVYQAQIAIKTLVSFLAMLMAYNLIPNKNNSFLGYIATNSFGVYLFHSPLIYLTYCYAADVLPLGVLIINFLLLGGISLAMTHIISKTIIRPIIGLPCQKQQ